jgi:transglutaminase-like putative cysteine protease
MKKDKLVKIGLAFLILFLLLPNLTVQASRWEEDLAIKIAEATDYRNRELKKFASHLANAFECDDEFEQIRLIYKYLESHWKYKKDPQGYENFAKASEVIDNGLKGDSDDFATTIASLFKAMGKPARIVVAHTDEKIKHIYAEVFLPKETLMQFTKGFQSSIWFDWDIDGGWVNLDYLSGQVGGPFRGGDNLLIVGLDGSWWLTNRAEEW